MVSISAKLAVKRRTLRAATWLDLCKPLRWRMSKDRIPLLIRELLMEKVFAPSRTVRN
jgi:hypothetical protein